MPLPRINSEHRNTLIATSVASKIIILLVTVIRYGQFYSHDFIGYYYAVTNILHGMWPWANGVEFPYPPLALFPMLIAIVFSVAGGFPGFEVGMWILMSICDVITTFGVYYIGLKLYSEKSAFIAAMLNATAFSVAYYVLTRFDSFPTTLAVVAVLATVYSDETKGYLGVIAGLFTKLWPMLLFPFLWLYNARESSIIAEGKRRAFWFLFAGILGFGFLLWIGYNKFLGYVMGLEITPYANTLPYTFSQYLQTGGVVVPFDVIANLIRLLGIAVILGAIFWMYKQPRSIAMLLKLILLTICVTIFFSTFRSPQFIVWFTPFAALLVAEDIRGIIAFYGVQVVAFFEYPLMYGVLWENFRYLSVWALGFFTVLFIAYGLLIWRALEMGPDRQPVSAPPWLVDRVNSLIHFLNTEKGMAFALLFFAIGFNAVFLWPEVGVSTFSLNDEVLHLTATRDAIAALHQNLDPTDFWLSQIELGFPLFHFYQHLPHVVLAGIDQVTSSILPLANLLDISRYLLLVFFPLSVFWAIRRMGFDYLAAGFSSSIASLLSTLGSYGFDTNSYVWTGYGLYTQLWVMFFLPLALAEIYRTIRREGSWFWPVFLSTVVLLSNLIYAYILVVSAAIFIFLTPEITEIFSRFKRWAIIFILTSLTTCYFFIPLILDRAYINRTIWFSSSIYDSYGAVWVLGNLFTGNLLDYGRLPILTLLFSLAALFVIWHWKEERYRLVLLVTTFWLFVYFGRPTWGHLLDILPFSQYLQLQRFIGGLHLGVILLTGPGLSLALQWMKKFSLKDLSLKTPPLVGVVKTPFLVGVAFLLILTPAFLERASFYQETTRMRTETQNIFSSKSTEIAEIQETLKNLPPGRVYAGLPADFGRAPYYRIGSVPLYAVFTQLGFDTFGYAYSGFDLSADVRYLFDNTKAEQYNLFNIRYVLLHNTWTPAYYYSIMKKFEDYTLYQVPTTGYFDLVDAPAVFYGNTTSIYYPNSKWLGSSLPRLKEHPIIELGDTPGNTHGLPVFPFQEVDEKILANLTREQPAGGDILHEIVSINGYQAQFMANRDCYLMLKTNYHPGWVVTLDGKKVTTVMLAPGYIGIQVTPGTHQVLFSYEPPLYRIPLLICGILLLVLLGLYQWKNIIGNFKDGRLHQIWEKYKKRIEENMGKI